MDDVRLRTRQFFSTFFKRIDLKDDTDIFALGVVNSLFAMQLVMFLEKEFQVGIENDDLDFDNFKSIDAIAGLIGRKSQAAARA